MLMDSALQRAAAARDARRGERAQAQRCRALAILDGCAPLDRGAARPLAQNLGDSTP
jgi:hypothetical protein